MRIRLHTSGGRRKRARVRQWVILAGSVCLLLFCVGGLLRYALQARRSAQISQTYQEIYYGEAALSQEQATIAQRGPVLRQFEVTFSSAASAEDNPAPTAEPKVGQWPQNPSMTVSEKLKKLRRQNKDVIGWLSIRFMLKIISKVPLAWFALYLAVIGVIYLVLQLTGSSIVPAFSIPASV